MNTPEGGKKIKETMIKKYGSYEAYKDFMRSIASTGGKNSSGYAFAHGKVDPVVAGTIGWEKKSKRIKNETK